MTENWLTTSLYIKYLGCFSIPNVKTLSNSRFCGCFLFYITINWISLVLSTFEDFTLHSENFMITFLTQLKTYQKKREFWLIKVSDGLSYQPLSGMFNSFMFAKWSSKSWLVVCWTGCESSRELQGVSAISQQQQFSAWLRLWELTALRTYKTNPSSTQLRFSHFFLFIILCIGHLGVMMYPQHMSSAVYDQ